MKPPISLANEYAAYLRRRYSEIQAAAEPVLLEGWDRNPAHWSGRLDSSSYVLRAIRHLIHVVETHLVPAAHLDGLAATIAKRNRVPGIPNPVPAHVMMAFRDKNLELITSLDREAINQLRGVLEVAETKGTRVETLRAEIQERFDVTRSHADLIARDQALKTNASVTEYRQTAAGITQYVWSTSNDARVRPDHDALDGETFSWSDPPVTDERTGDQNHPGMDIQCRCIAVPVMPE